MSIDYDNLMRIALDEARLSLREGNSGFGAVVAQGTEVLARAHDLDESDGDPTAHAELLAIRLAAQRLGRDLSGCVLVATHEPCPMCATATVWAGITEVAFGYSIEEALAEGRRRIPLPAAEVFARAGVAASITPAVLHEECSILYRRDVRAQVRRLRGAEADDLVSMRDELTDRRRQWVAENHSLLPTGAGDPIQAGYELLLAKLGIDSADAPIVERSSTRLVFHSRNFCPTLEACRILGLDSRVICRAVTEEPMEAMLREFDSRLKFSRNYDYLRPYADACEEVIALDERLAPAETGANRAPSPDLSNR